jgi:hypothetical protein
MKGIEAPSPYASVSQLPIPQQDFCLFESLERCLVLFTRWMAVIEEAALPAV